MYGQIIHVKRKKERKKEDISANEQYNQINNNSNSNNKMSEEKLSMHVRSRRKNANTCNQIYA